MPARSWRDARRERRDESDRAEPCPPASLSQPVCPRSLRRVLRRRDTEPGKDGTHVDRRKADEPGDLLPTKLLLVCAKSGEVGEAGDDRQG